MSTPVYKKHLAALVAAILVLSSSLAVYSFQGTGTAYGSYYDLGVSLSPEGSVKLGVAEPQEFVATVSGGDYPYTFTWTSQVHYKDNKTTSPLVFKQETFTQEWTEKYFANQKPISKWTFDGFPYATEDYFTVMVEVTDVSGAKQSEMCFVFDPYTSPTQYLNGANLAAFSYKIETDGLGWYRAVSGTDGAISWTSTNASSVINNAAALLPFNGKLVLVGNITLTSEIEQIDNTIIDLTQAALIVHATDYVSDHVIESANNCTIIGGLIDGQNSDLPTSAICFSNKHGSTVEGVEITRIKGMGIMAASGAYNMRFENNYIHDLPAYAATGKSYGIVIETNEVADCYDNYVVNNKISNVQGNCISIVSDTPYTKAHYREHIVGNTLSNSGVLDGIQLYFNVFDSVVADNIITDTARTGIKIDGSSRNVISGNTIQEKNLATMYYGIEITSGGLDGKIMKSENNIVSNNIICLPHGYMSINIQGQNGNESTRNLIIGNQLYGNNFYTTAQAMLWLNYASYTTIKDNYLYYARTNAIGVNNSMYCDVSGNTVERNGWDTTLPGHGIYFQGDIQHFSTCTYNKIIFPSVGNTTNNAILISGEFVTVQYNYIREWDNPTKMTTGVRELTGSDYNLISFNTFESRMATMNITTVGARTAVENNTFRGAWLP